MNKVMDADFIEPQGLFSINPQQVTKIEYHQNEIYFFFNNSEMAGMWLKFPNEEALVMALKEGLVNLNDVEVGEE